MQVDNVEDLYKLSPAQQDTLAQSLAADSPNSPDAQAAQVRQAIFHLEGELDRADFERAWQQAFARHAVLRTSFHWEGLEKPLQVVARRAPLQIEQHDWRQLSGDEQPDRLRAALEADRARGFDLNAAPLVRLSLVNISDATHLLVLSYHRLVLDELSARLVVAEVCEGYASLRPGAQAAPPAQSTRAAQPLAFKDYVSWLRRQDATAAETFWRHALENFDSVTTLDKSQERPDDASQRQHPRQQQLQLSDVAASSLQAFAAQHRLGLDLLLQAAWALLLSRYNDEQDVVFGATFSGRPDTLEGAQSIPGAFAQTLPVRFRVAPAARLSEWLQSLAARQRETAQHQHVSLSELRVWNGLSPEQALFESVVYGEQDADDAWQHQGASLNARALSMPAAAPTNVNIALDYPLAVALTRGAQQQLSLRISYDARRFADAFVKRMLTHLATLLERMQAEPEQRLAELSLLSESERRQLLVGWNDTPHIYPLTHTIQELYETQAAATPDAVAVVYEEESLTYSELNERANQLARHLRTLGVAPELPVGVFMNRSLETLTALLGILKAGGTYLPLDPAYPQERLAFMLEDTQVTVLITQQHLLFDLPPYAAAASEVICLDAEWDTVAQQATDNLEQNVTPDNLAYIIYTSGSTGTPKGVGVPHSAAASHLLTMRQAFGLKPEDRMLQFASLNFDVSLEQLLAPLCSGATLVLRDEETLGAREFLAYMAAQRLTVVNLPPAYWNQLTQELSAGGDALEEASRLLRLMIVGGDALPLEAVRRWQQLAFSASQLLNAYGPTETTITATLFDVPPRFAETASEQGLRSVPVGRALGARRVYVLDRSGQLAAVGARGELHIGGGLLARGYLRRADLTAERFVPDSFSTQVGARMYATGDEVRWREDGVLEFLGRRDEQVKVRGYRIELGEVERAIAEQAEWVRECVAAVKADESGEKRLVAYVVAGEAESRVGELRDLLREKLPEHMIPSVFVTLEALPLTPNGKVDKRALPEPDGERPELSETFVAASGFVEERLVEIWEELLGVRQVGVNDNFFDLGGDSLLATQLMSRVQKTFGTEIPLRALFDAPTIASLAQSIEATPQPESVESAPVIERAPRDEALPLSFAQERLWFMSRLEPRSPLFNIPAALRLTGVLDVRALEQSFAELIRRHESLRTSFMMKDDAPVQVVNPAQPLSLPVTDLSALTEDERQSEVARLAFAETQRVFDLTQSPLLRAQLLRLDETEHVLLVTMHHIVSDGWSIGVMTREVAALYEAFSAGKASPLAPLAVQYADFARWQREWLRGEVLEGQLDYWRQRLGGNLPELRLPTDRPRPAAPTFKGATSLFTLPLKLSAALRELSRREGATMFMTLMAAFQTLLARYSSQEDIIVGTDIANRNRAETEALIGFFVNLLPIRVSTAGNPTFRALLEQVRDVTLGAYAHQDVPFGKLVSELQPERSLNRAPLFQVLFVMQNAPMPALAMGDLRMSVLEVDEETAKFDLAVFMEETAEGLSARWNYSTELFESSTIRRMFAHFERLLESIVEQLETRLGALEMLTEEEKQRQASEDERRQESKLGRLRRASRKAVNLTQASIVKTGHLLGCEGMPLVVEPATDEVDLADWASHERAHLDGLLLKHGALLFRNFRVETVAEFQRCASAICPELFSEYGDLPREEVGGKVYGSTPYPSDQAILFHNESSHLHRWPMKIWFYCVRAAERGGETPLVDCRRVYELLSPELRARFAEKGLMYVRNYTEGLDVSWQDFFRTTSRESVEEQCREGGIEWEWLGGNNLQTRKRTSAVAQHPKTGETVFFNQVQLHHASCLDAAVRESLLGMFGEERLPRNVFYGDGTPIEDAVMEEVGEAYRRAVVSFPWQPGDILMLDNMLAAHGRNPFEGERKIVVALGEMLSETQLLQTV